MRKLFWALALFMVLLWPSTVFAADLKMNVNLVRLEDGSACGELIYNDNVIWRLEIMPDGAQPVAGITPPRTTVVIPAIANGFFWLQIQNR